MFSFRDPLIIGPVSVEADVVACEHEIVKVEFYVNDDLMLVLTT